ncbi:MAG: hypothetical protein ACR2QK_09850, partial [Acidimicrobiales bacterium]
EVFYRLHVRETELEQLKQLLAEGDAPGTDGDGGADSGMHPGPSAGPMAGKRTELGSPTPIEALRILIGSIRTAISGR